MRHKIVKTITPKVFQASVYMNELATSTPRPVTLIVQSHFIQRNSLVGAEIGVSKGDNTLSILQQLPMERLYLIDPYVPYVEYGGPPGVTLSNHSTYYNVAKKRLSSFPQAIFIKKRSDEAYKDIHEPLDFVYIDGNHNYEYVMKDISLYYPLIQPNGIIGGHDYMNSAVGVVKATNEFTEQNKLKLHSLLSDWWIFKQEYRKR